MDYCRSKLSEHTCCVLILQLICRNQSLLPRLPANQHQTHKWIQQTMILLCSCVLCVCASSKPPVINKAVSVRLNHAVPPSKVNTRVNGEDGYNIVSVFSVGPLILNNNDFLMWNCDYIVTVKYSSA